MNLSIKISDERRDLICEKYGYTETIKVNTGATDKEGNPVYVEKPLSKEDFITNWYTGVIESDSITIKAQKARATAEQAIAESTVLDEPAVFLRPSVSQDEIDEAIALADAKAETTKLQNNETKI